MTHSSCDRAQGDRLAFCWAFDTFSICKNRAGLKLDGSALLGWKWGSVCLTRVILLMLTAGLDYITHINPHSAATVEIKGFWILISWEAKNLCWFKFTKWHCWESVKNLVVLLRFLSDKNKTTNCVIYSHYRTHTKKLFMSILSLQNICNIICFFSKRQKIHSQILIVMQIMFLDADWSTQHSSYAAKHV